MIHKPPNKNIPIPHDYVENMRHYIPDFPMAAIKDAWLHNATPSEVMAHLDRLKGQK